MNLRCITKLHCTALPCIILAKAHQNSTRRIQAKTIAGGRWGGGGGEQYARGGGGEEGRGRERERESGIAYVVAKQLCF